MSSHFHFANQSCPILSANCRHNLRLFRLFRSNSSGMDKSSSGKCLLYSDVVKGEPSPTRRGRRSRDKKAIKELEIFVSQIFYNFFLFISFFSITLLYHFFSMLFLPTAFTHTHTHDPRHLATLRLCSLRSEFGRKR